MTAVGCMMDMSTLLFSGWKIRRNDLSGRGSSFFIFFQTLHELNTLNDQG